MASPAAEALLPEIQADFDFVGNTFISKDKEPEVEVGDIKLANFEPQVKIKRWDNEANFSVRLQDTAPGQSSVTVDKEKIVWAKGDREAHFYAQGFGVDNGAFEFEVVLLAKPTSNVISFSIQSKLLKFFYQPPLTAQEIADGAHRPENVVGSYAVYHATKENLHPSKAEADKYKSGKAFHIYRPQVTDALGSQIWADLNIDVVAGTLTITIDQAWLDAATYPVVIDPNFGYETAGSSSTAQAADWMIGALFTSPGDVDTADSLTFSTSTGAGTSGKAVLVAHGDSTILTNGVGDAVALSASQDWNTSTFGTSPSLSASTAYVLLFVFDGNWVAYYDSGDTNQGHYDTSNSYASPTNPSLSHLNNKYSIYCTYTASGGGVTVTVPLATLSASLFVPTVLIPQTITPGVTSLSTATFTPVVGLSVIPPPIALSLATFAPAVTATANQLVVPPILGLMLAAFAPVVKLAVIPPTQTLTLSAFTPTVAITANQLITPPVQTLVLAEFVPTITTTGNRLVTPPTVVLTLSTLAPTVTATGDQLVTPPTLALALVAFAPTVTATANVVITPATIALALATFVPTTPIGFIVTPGVIALSTTPFAPTILLPVTVTPPTVAVILTTFVPGISVTGGEIVAPGALALTLTVFAPIAVKSTYESVGAPFLYTAANWGNAVEFFLEVFFRSTSGTARARLYSATDGIIVADSGLSTTSATLVRLRSGALTLVDGKSYFVQFGTEDAASGAFKGAKIVAV